MECMHCNGSVEWRGPLSNLTHTECTNCGAHNSQRVDPEPCYRCGWCGQPCDEHGRVLSADEANVMNADWDAAEQVYGDCCPNGNRQEHERQIITREMALDAGCPEMEGMEW